MSRLAEAMEAKREKDCIGDEWVPPWYTGEAGYIWPAGRVLKVRPATLDEVTSRVDRLRATGHKTCMDAADIMISEVAKRNIE